MIIKNALIYTPRHTFEEGSLTIREGRIVPFAQPEEGEEIVDAKGAYALPGLVDIHFHGAMGKDVTAMKKPSRPWPILRPVRACWPSAPPP